MNKMNVVRYMSSDRKKLERIEERLLYEKDLSEIKYLVELKEIIEIRMSKKFGGDAI